MVHINLNEFTKSEQNADGTYEADSVCIPRYFIVL
jgi:hypothetical protein